MLRLNSAKFSQQYIPIFSHVLSFSLLPLLCLKFLPTTFTFFSPLNIFHPVTQISVTVKSVFFPYAVLIAKEFVAKVIYLFLETIEPEF